MPGMYFSIFFKEYKILKVVIIFTQKQFYTETIY